VSLSRGGEVIALKELNEGKFSHAEKLHVFIRELFQESGISMHDLHAIAISKGPGSYTGLRIGVSAAKGLCYALEKPLISVPTLQIMALQVPCLKNELVVPLLDARRMEVYSAVFDHDYHQTRETMAEIIDEKSFESILNKGVVHIAGDGAQKCVGMINHVNVRFLPDIYPSAREMAIVSDLKLKEADFEDVAYFEPYYLKDFVAGKPKKFFN
jgi:tRNA threonylcarbamoyladenosine biosynthesis protein TsaB